MPLAEPMVQHRRDAPAALGPRQLLGVLSTVLVGLVLIVTMLFPDYNAGLRSGTVFDAVVALLSVTAATLFPIAFLQISVNVGLESPRFFPIYILSMSFALCCLKIAAFNQARRACRTSPLAMARTLPSC